MVRSGTVWAWDAVAPSNIASANVLVSFICFSLEPFPEPYQKRCGSVLPDEGSRPPRLLVTQTFAWFQAISHELFVANSELGTPSQRAGTFRAKACPGLDP